MNGVRHRTTWLTRFVLWMAITTSLTNVHAATTNGFVFIDLSPAAVTLGPGKPVRSVPTGRQQFGGVPFHVGEPLAVNGLDAARDSEFLPIEARGLKVGARLRRLHLLHAALSPEKDGVPLAKVVFHYADGAAESVRIGYGVHTRDWTAPRIERRSELLDPNSRLAWSDGDVESGASLRLFQTALANPRPDAVVERIDVVSLFSRAAPIVFALTGETPESTLPPNAPAPNRRAWRDLQELPDGALRKEVVVRVTDAVSGGPATNALTVLALTDDKHTFYFGEARANADGLCRFIYPALHAAALTFWVHAPGRAPTVVKATRSGGESLRSEYGAVLERGTTIGGFVYDTAGRPIQNAEVLIHRVRRSGNRTFERTDLDAVRSGPDGKWTSSSLVGGVTGLTFQVFHPDFRGAFLATPGYTPAPTNLPTGSATTTTRRLADGSVTTVTSSSTRRAGLPTLLDTNALLAGTAEIRLQPALLLEGTVIASAKPLTNAEVILQRSPLDRKFLRTDHEGRFRTRIGENGLVSLMVLQEGFSPFFTNVSVTTRTPALTLRLAPARTIIGLVRERNQRPVPGARVRLEEWNGTTDLLRFQVTTDQEGRFTWEGAPKERVLLSVFKTNYSTMRTSFSTIGDNLALTLSRPYGVYGKAYDARTKQAIPYFTVIPGRKYSTSDPQIHWERSESAIGRDGEYSLRMQSYYFQPEARVLIEAPGYTPQVSVAFKNYDSYTNDFALEPGKGIAGQVQLPDGSPAPGATLVLVETGDAAMLDHLGVLRGTGGSDMARADSRGRFEFNPKLKPDKIFVTHDAGFAAASVENVQRGQPIKLQPWGGLEGVVRVGDTNSPSHSLRLSSVNNGDRGPDGRGAYLYMSARFDPEPDGSFSLRKVAPGDYQIGVEYRFKENNYGEVPVSHTTPIAVKPATVAKVTLGGKGRRVTGKVALQGGTQGDVDWKRDVHRLNLVAPAANIPVIGSVLGDFTGESYVLLFDSNGVFYADNVPPGRYQLTLNVTDPEDEYYNRRTIGATNHLVVVPDKKAPVNAPFDMGTVALAIRPRVKPGSVVPSFDMPMLDGRKLKLSDFKGKFVLLHFWGRSLGWSSYDIQVLKELHTTVGASGKLAVIGCNLDSESDANSLQQFVKSQGLDYPQASLGYWHEAPVPRMFGLNGQTASVLIDPQGRLASGHLRGSALRSFVQEAMNSGTETE
jgi:peroxiredoxin